MFLTYLIMFLIYHHESLERYEGVLNLALWKAKLDEENGEEVTRKSHVGVEIIRSSW